MPSARKLACDLRSKKSSVGIVFNSALVKRRRCHKVADNHGGPTNSGSALGAVLGDDDCVHTCRGSKEADINPTVERHQLQSVFNKPSTSKCNKDAVGVLSTLSSPSFEVRDGPPPNNTPTVSDLSNSALHAPNSGNNSGARLLFLSWGLLNRI